MGLGALNQLAVTHAHTPSAVRPFFLTFRGTTYVNPKEAGAGRTRLLDLVHLSTAAKRIVVAVQCHKLHGEHKLPAYSDRCSAYDEAMRLAPEYTTLLNTTFALVPGGRVHNAVVVVVVHNGRVHNASQRGDGSRSNPRVYKRR